MIDHIIEDNKLKDTYAYLDNVTVAGRTLEEHDENVRKFLEVAKNRNLTLNHDKTVSSTEEIKILGYEIKNGQIKPDPDRLRPLEDLPPPTTKKSL